MLSSARDSFFDVSPRDSCMKKELSLVGNIGGIWKFFHTPFMFLSSSILKMSIWSAKLKVLGEILSPCALPRSNEKLRLYEPLSSKIQAVRFSPNKVSQSMIDGPKLKNLKNFSQKVMR